MSEIKRGDLVMVKRGTDGRDSAYVSRFIGIIRTVGEQSNIYKGSWYLSPMVTIAGVPMSFDPDNLRKIDPPATGEYDGVAVRKTIKHKEPA